MTAPRKLAACDGKVAFSTWADAERAAKRRRRNADGVSIAPYHCRDCGKVHLGTGEPVRDQAKLARFIREQRKAGR